MKTELQTPDNSNFDWTPGGLHALRAIKLLIEDAGGANRLIKMIENESVRSERAIVTKKRNIQARRLISIALKGRKIQRNKRWFTQILPIRK